MYAIKKISIGMAIVLIVSMLIGCQPQATELPTPPPTPTAPLVLYDLSIAVDPPEAGIAYPSSGQYEAGVGLDLRAKPINGYTFDHWSGDVSDDSSEIAILLDANKSVTAHFRRISMLKTFELDEKSYSTGQTGNILMDFDSDGDLDLILNQFDWPPPQDPQAVLAYRNDGAGNFVKAAREVFADTPLVTTNIGDWAVEDFNGDGRDDLLLADGGQDHDPFPGGQSLILIQNENGQLIDETQARLPQQMAFTHSVATGDIDQDGDIDIYMGNIWGSTQIGPCFYINDGNGFFSEDTTRIPGEITRLERKFTSSLLLDVDQDGDLDLVLGGHDNAGKRDVILLNDGAGMYAYAPDESMPLRLGGPGFNTVAINSADFNKDGWPDLVMSTHLGYQFDANLQLLINNGDGTFKDETFRIEQDWSVYRNPDCIGENAGWLVQPYIVDANNDTWPDILVQGDRCLQDLLFLSDNGERFAVTENYSQFTIDNGMPPWALVPGDIDNDGNLDVVLIYTSMTQQVYLRIPSEEPTVSSTASEPESATNTVQSELTFTDEFDTELQPGWEWVSDEEAHWSLSENPGYLQVTLWTGYTVDRLLRQPPEGDFEITTRVRINPTSNFQSAGLTIYQDNENVINLVRGFCSLPGTRDACIGKGIYFDKTLAGAWGWSNFPTETGSEESYLKIRREGNRYTGYYSEDGENWIEIGTHTADFESIRIGLTAGGSSYAINAEFDYFTLYEFP